MSPIKMVKLDWDADVRSRRHAQPKIEKNPAKFIEAPTTLAWLEMFASQCSKGRTSFKLEDKFPWLWNPQWIDSFGINVAGVQALASAVRQAEAMESSLESFLRCVKDRITRIRTNLKVTVPQSYFPLLSDDVLAMIFEFAAMPFSQITGEEYDNKTPSRISQVSRRFRTIALSLPRLWRYVDAESDMELIASRSALAGPILEVFVAGMKSTSTVPSPPDRIQRLGQIYAFVGRIAMQTSRISFLRFDLSPFTDDDLFRKTLGDMKFSSLSFPSLYEMVLNYDGGVSAHRRIQFYREWSMPSLRVLNTRNVIPEFQALSLYSGILECYMTFDEGRQDGRLWKFSAVAEFLKAFSGITKMNITMRGAVVQWDCDMYGTVSLPSVEYLRTALPGMDLHSMRGFFRTFRTPNKKHWIMEVSTDKVIAVHHGSVVMELFSSRGPTKIGLDNSLNSNLKEVDIIFRGEFERNYCGMLSTIAGTAHGVENLSVTFISVTEQLRRIELKGCKGKLASTRKVVEDRFGELALDNPHLIVEGSELQDSE